MKILFIFFLLVSALGFSAAPELMTGWEKLTEQGSPPVLDMEGTVMGVNVTNGSYHESALDFISKGLDPVKIERSFFREAGRSDLYLEYDTPNLLGWHVNYDHVFYASSNPQYAQEALFSHPSGSLLYFTKYLSSRLVIDSLKGFVNTSGGVISGQTHLKNMYIPLPQRRSRTYEVHLPDGGLVVFNLAKGHSDLASTHFAYKRNPSGSVAAMEGDKLVTRAADGTILNWLRIEKQGNYANIETSDQKTFKLTPTREYVLAGGHLIENFFYPDGAFVKYSYTLSRGTPLIHRKEMPEGRYLQTHFDGLKRISALSAPAGKNGEAVFLYRFQYAWLATNVWDAMGNRTCYEYDNEDRRITRVLKYEGNDKLLRIEKNVWHKPDGCLLAKIILTPAEVPVCARTFQYDAKGNVISERLYGSLTGKKAPSLKLGRDDLPIENGVEYFEKRYTYYDNDFNLLASESDGSCRTEYTYVPNTNLLAAKFVYDEQNVVRLRQFRSYDSMGALAEVIEDDGNTKEASSLSGCTVRKIKRIRNRREFPGVGQPEFAEELYFDFKEGKEKTLKTALYHYNKHNEAVQEDVHDAEGRFAYALKKEYDLHGRCIFETDPLGHAIRRFYDGNGNLVKECGPHPDLEIEHGYDLQNHRIWTLKKDLATGITKKMQYAYDLAGNCISQTDERGNETRCAYDGLYRKAREETPLLMTVEGVKRFQKKFVYNVLDQAQAVEDEEGGIVHTLHNIRGQPIEIKTIYPTGKEVIESFTYDLKGNLITKVSPNGLTTRYAYDFLDRVTSVSHISAEGETLSQTYAFYNAFSLTRTTDALGVETSIEYDGAGREIQVAKGSYKLAKEYDALGRLAKQKEWSSPTQVLVKRFTYDMKGQLLEEACEQEDILYCVKKYAYDETGNKTKVISYSNLSTPQETSFVFDAFGREIQKTDPLGHIWQTEYRDDLKSAAGYGCAFMRQIKPDGCMEESYFNPKGLCERQLKKDAKGEILSQKEFFYDGLSNLVKVKEGEIETCFYFEGKKQIRIEEEANQENPRKTFFTYDLSGNLICKETVQALHHFSYTPLGKVCRHLALNKQKNEELAIEYEYDLNGNLVKACQNGKETIRKYNENGNVIYERQESGLEVRYDYDWLGRRLAMKLPDRSSVRYSYKGPYLHKVYWLRKDGELLASHHYQERDLAGRVLCMELAGGQKKAFQEYDAAGRLISVRSSLFGQEAVFDACGNIVEVKNHDLFGLLSQFYTYNGIGQIVEENGQKYAYDHFENRLDGEIGRFNQLVQGAGCSFLYNAEGYLIEAKGDRGFACAYDPLGRMTTFQETHYEYDALNRRMKKNDTVFLYDGMNEIGICDSSGNFLEFRMLGEGKGAEMGSTLAVLVKSKIYSVVNDVRGNLACLEEIAGKNWEYYRYSAFGEAQVFVSNPKNEPVSPWKFCGKREDQESGLIFFGRRYYMPQIGRWTTPDPLGFVDGSNLYAFVHNNPMTHYDLYGLYDRYEERETRNILEGIEWVYHRTMSVIDWIGKNLIIIPGVRDVIECVGRGLSTGNFFDEPEYLQNKTEILKIDGYKMQGHTFGSMNGMWNLKGGGLRFGEEYSKNLKGVEVFAIYNATNGLITDLLECVAVKFGVLSTPAREFIKWARDTWAKNPDEMIHMAVHSQAGLHLYNALKHMQPGERAKIEVVTFGSAKIIPAELASKVQNNISRLDVVPMTDSINYVKALSGGLDNISFLQPSSFSPLKEHGMMEPTYNEAFKVYCDDLLERLLH